MKNNKKTKKTPLLSLVIPAHNEEGVLENTVNTFHNRLKQDKIPHEILVINDNSSDSTEEILIRLEKSIKELRHINNVPPNGFGFAVRKGLENFKGDYVAVVMADLSDDPNDLVVMYNKAIEGYDAVFGSRFSKTAQIIDYPSHKLLFNRLGNNFIRLLFWIKYNDVSNAFKLYKRETIAGLKPFLSHHFSLTVELPLKVIIRGYSYAVVPTNWTNRAAGVSKLNIKEMSSRYFFIIFYCFLEKLLSRGDYNKK